MWTPWLLQAIFIRPQLNRYTTLQKNCPTYFYVLILLDDETASTTMTLDNFAEYEASQH